MPRSHLAAAVLLATLPSLAQEHYWVANRTSSDIMRVSSWGSVLERVATPTNVRSCTRAPDGKVWIVRFIQPTFDVYDPATATMTPVPLPSGNAFQIVFDAAGHAWISNGASAVHEFDANGTFLQTIALSAGAALGITVDASGNKWVAHRVTPPSVSRIDPAGVATNFPFSIATSMTPGNIIADYRGIGNPSRIWVTGDGASQIAEIDSTTGATLNVYTLPFGSVGNPVFDLTGRLWVSSFGNGTIVQLDETNGSVLQTLTLPPNNIQLAVDNLGRLRATSRATAPAPCEVRRIDPVTGALEIPTTLTFGTLNGTGTQAATSTQFQYSLVVAPTGDLDGDGEANLTEVLGGTSPTDATANSTFRIESFGVTQNGSTATFDVRAAATTLWVLGAATALAAPTTVPGFGGTLHLDLATVAATVAGVGNATFPLVIPVAPTLVGFEFFVQGAIWNGVGFDFRNLTGLKVW